MHKSDMLSTHIIKKLQSTKKEERDTAAQQLVDHYAVDLFARIRSNLHPRLRVRESEEDVGWDVFRTYIRRIDENPDLIKDRCHAKNLLFGIAVCRAKNVIRDHYQTEKRTVRMEELSIPLGDREEVLVPIGLLEAMTSSGPTPDEATEIVDLLNCCAAQLDPASREILELRLGNHTCNEICTILHIPASEVKRKLKMIKKKMRKLLEEGGVCDE